MGRSRGGLTTKIHAVVDAEGLPIALKLSEGQAHDGRSAQDLLGTLRQGDILLADRVYESAGQQAAKSSPLVVPVVPLPQVIHLVETDNLSVLKLANNDPRGYALLLGKPDHL